MADLCIVCSRPVTNRHQGLLCEPCNRWQHRVCGITNITQAVYRAAVANGTPLDWQCDECMATVVDIDSLYELSTVIDSDSSVGDIDSNSVFEMPDETERLATMRQMAADIEGDECMSSVDSDSSDSVFETPGEVAVDTFRSILHSTAISSDMSSILSSPGTPVLSSSSSSTPNSPMQIASPASPTPPGSPASQLSPPTNGPNYTATFNLDSVINTPLRHEESTLEDPTPIHAESAEPAITTYNIVDRGTQRRARMLTDSAGYSYTIKREGKKISTWRCSVRSKALWCRATVVQKGDDFTPGPLEHQHPSSAGITTATKVRAAMKDRCVGDMFTSAKTIVNNVLKDIRKSPEEPIDALQGPDLLERILNRFRAGHRPTDPKSLDFELDLNWIPANFLQKDIRGEDYRHIVFATEEMLHLLSISKVWYIDATFKVISKPFTQLWSIHAFVKHGEACKQIPLAFVMMSGKRTLDYKMVLEAINDILPTEANVLRFVMDFEMGEWQAVATVYPHAECMGCGFHWVQCLWRKIQELGLVIAYRDDAATRQYCRRLMALLFLPSEHIVDMFRQLRAKAMTVPLAKLTTYMFETWIVNRTWTPASWSVYNQLVRTNNDVEGWHAMLNRAAKRGSLQLYVLVELLHQQAENVDLQVRLVHGEKLTRRQRVMYRKIQDKLCKAWEGYRSSNMTNKDAKKLLDTCTDLMAP